MNNVMKRYLKLSISFIVAICIAYLFYKLVSLTSWELYNKYLVDDEDRTSTIFHTPIFAMPFMLWYAINSILTDKKNFTYSVKICIAMALYFFLIIGLDLLTDYKIYDNNISLFSLLLLVAFYGASVFILLAFIFAALRIGPGYDNR